MRIVLGLFISKEFNFIAEFQLGFILFPHRAKSSVTPQDVKRLSETRNSRKRQAPLILIADRDNEFVSSLSQQLTTKGFECIPVDSANEAYSRSLEAMPDVVVIGCNITREGDGLQVAKQILSRRSLTEVVVLTDLDSEIGKKTERIGVELFIKRSLGVEKIVSSICGICELKKSSFRLIAK